MEILGFLVLGLIAMLAIVPPLVRGRIEESPLDSTKHFRKSMLEMAASVNPSEYGRAPFTSKRKLNVPLLFSGINNTMPQQTPQGSYGRSPHHMRRAAERRMRVYAVLGTLAAGTCIAAVIARTAVVTAIFFIACGLLLLYFFLVQFMVRRK